MQAFALCTQWEVNLGETARCEASECLSPTGDSVTAARRTNVADNTSAALPEKMALDAAGFCVSRASHKRPLGEVWRIGMRCIAADEDHEAIIMDGFHSSGPFPSCLTLGRHESEFHDRRRVLAQIRFPRYH